MNYKISYHTSVGYAVGGERHYNFANRIESSLELAQAIKKALVEEHIANAISNIELDVLIGIEFEESKQKHSEIFELDQ